MFLPYVSEFVEFLSVKDHTLEEILAHMVLRVLRPLEGSSAFLSQLNDENRIENVAQYGISKKDREPYSEIHDLKEELPITDCIKNRKIVWITTLPNWPEEYAQLANENYDSGEKTFICFPIEKCGTPVAALGIFCKSVIHPDAEIDAFLRAIGNLFALHVYRSIDSPLEQRHLETKDTIQNSRITNSTLTERQELILRMMSEDRTNLNIGELLGYSESTIRQESIRIYAVLNCNGREDASRIYTERLTLVPKIS
jgi:DNA-binding CsgD family transcriptional regulator